jgi:DNA-directed RNA polymerase subunit RPC12/RpoP
MEGYKPKIPQMGTQTADVCQVCNEKVFFNERVKSEGHCYHKTCFKCFSCHKTLTQGKETLGKDEHVYCDMCYKKLFGIKTVGHGAADVHTAPQQEATKAHSFNPSTAPKMKGLGGSANAFHSVSDNTRAHFEAGKTSVDAANSALAAAMEASVAQNDADLEQMRKDAEELERLMSGAAVSTSGEYDAFLDQLEKVRAANPDNRCAKYLTKEIFLSFTPEQQTFLYRCARSGVDNPGKRRRIL